VEPSDGGAPVPPVRSAAPRAPEPSSDPGATPPAPSLERTIADSFGAGWDWMADQVVAIEDRVFPPLSGPSTNRRGVLSTTLAEWPAVTIALLIGLAAATLLEWTMLARPIPPGGDPGQWLSTSYAYVGLPYPSWVIPGQYPPLLFPLLGSLVLLSGSAIGGARAYVGLVAVLLGLSLYFLARGVTRRRSTALLAEAIVLLNPTLLSMFFWGFYPNLLGFVFMNLSLGFLLRFIRSRRPLHLYLFWLFAACSFLTHTLVGTVLAGTVALFLIGTVLFRVLPREFYRSRAAILGLGTFVVAVGGFYALTAALLVPHPDYFGRGAFAYVRDRTPAIFNLILHPFVPTLTVQPDSSVLLLWGISAALILYAVAVRWFGRKPLTLGAMLVLAMAAGPLLLAAVGWELAVVTDYTRFSYFLVAPIGIGLALGLDRILTAVGWGLTPPPVSAPAGPARASSLFRWHLEGSRGSVSTGAILLTVSLVMVVGISTFVSTPALRSDEKVTTTLGHNSAFLGALQLIRESGIPGSVLTVPGVAKWTRAILDRSAYFPNIEARYTFDPDHLTAEQETYFALTSRYVATNGIVAATELGTNLSAGNGTFAFQPAYYGSFGPVLTLPIANLTVVVGRNQAPQPVEIDTGGSVALATDGPSSFTASYLEPGFELNVTVSVPSGGTVATFNLTATAAPGYHIHEIAGEWNLTGRGSYAVGGNGSQTFVVHPARYGGALATGVTVTPGNAVRAFRGNQTVKGPVGFRLGSINASGVRSLVLTFAFSTPGAALLLPGLPSLLTTDQTFANWSVRFVLYTVKSSGEGILANLLGNEVDYLEAEYGATVLGTSGPWTVLVLPGPEHLANGPRPAPSSPGG
jgi:hypothetical protein